VTVVQARRGSTRLPNKVLLPLAGAPLLVRMVERVRAARLVGTVIVATTTDSPDDSIVELCAAEGIACVRGNPTDLLERHYRVGKLAGAAHVVKIPSDCPLIDPDVIDAVLRFYLERPGWFEYVSNLHPATFPDGNDVEVMPFPVLTRAHREATKPAEREHTTPYVWDNPHLFRVGNVAREGEDLSLRHRWTIDYPADYELIRSVYEQLYRPGHVFRTAEVLEYLAAHPEVSEANAGYRGVNWYRHHLHELKTVSAAQTRFPDGERAGAEAH
jgi:spore coat polysaccharide biosynthesis protein SpsF